MDIFEQHAGAIRPAGQLNSESVADEAPSEDVRHIRFEYLSRYVRTSIFTSKIPLPRYALFLL